AENQQDADRYNTKTDPAITTADKAILLDANTQGAGDKGVTTDLDIYVPANSGLVITSVKGDVTIQGKANEVAVEDVDGAVHLNGEFQESVRLARISKTVSFRSSRTDMEFSRLDGRLDLDSGDLRADSLTGPMHLTTRSKDIALEGLSGDLRLEDANGMVEV